MKLSRVYQNPEAKRVTIKFIIILVLGILAIVLSSLIIAKNLSLTLLNQNSVLLANVLEDKQQSELVRNFYQSKSEEEIDEAKKILSSYGYDENTSFSANDIVYGVFKNMLLFDIPIISLFLIILYFQFIKELRGVYQELNNVVISIENMAEGKYNEIEGAYVEGEMAILKSSLNFIGDRVNNSIELLSIEKENLKDFLSDISHQLKTPLASLVMFNDLLRENENMPYQDRIQFLDKSEEQLRRMEWLIMNLLKVGRLEANAINFNNEMQPLRETIELAVSSLKGEAKKKNQEFTVCGQLDSQVVHDKEWLAEALSNIIKNSIEHTECQGKIQVEVSKGPIITKIYIKDNGVGISKEMQKKVFKRFYKGESSKDPKSIGIGLSLSKSIIEEMGGEIKLISEEGEGSTFIVSFYTE
jgi:signal transduction histidine kinase